MSKDSTTMAQAHTVLHIYCIVHCIIKFSLKCFLNVRRQFVLCYPESSFFNIKHFHSSSTHLCNHCGRHIHGCFVRVRNCHVVCLRPFLRPNITCNKFIIVQHSFFVMDLFLFKLSVSKILLWITELQLWSNISALA